MGFKSKDPHPCLETLDVCDGLNSDAVENITLAKEHNPGYLSAAATASCVCTVASSLGNLTHKAALLMEEKVLNMEYLCLSPCDLVPDSHSCISQLQLSLHAAGQALSPVLWKPTGGTSISCRN